MALQQAPCHIHGKSASGASCRRCAELTALRMYRCARCGKTALICSRCDRGNIYCAAGCAKTARRESLRRAGGRYRQSKKGNRKHAASQGRYRRQQQQKVTHQGTSDLADLVKTCLAPQATQLAQEEPDVPKAAVFKWPLPPLVEYGPSPQPPVHPGLPPAPAKAPRRAAITEHVCDFCRRTGSRYLRREPLCQLRRRTRHRPP